MDKNKLLQFKSKKRLFSKLQGEHKSLFSGSGVEFLELREYSTSNSAKHINWKRSLNSNTPLVNIYTDERELNITLVYLISGSLEYKDKKELARDILATLSYSATKFNERLTIILFSNKVEAIYSSLKAINGFEFSYHITNNLTHLGKSIDYNNLSFFLESYLKERSLIFLIGDFLDKNIDIKSISLKNELFALLVRDKSEESINAKGEIEAKDPISLKIERLFISRASAKSYNNKFKEQDKSLFKEFNRYGIKYTKFYKSEDILEKLKRLISG